jgi:hypothetical protein
MRRPLHFGAALGVAPQRLRARGRYRADLPAAARAPRCGGPLEQRAAGLDARRGPRTPAVGPAAGRADRCGPRRRRAPLRHLAVGAAARSARSDQRRGVTRASARRLQRAPAHVGDGRPARPGPGDRPARPGVALGSVLATVASGMAPGPANVERHFEWLREQARVEPAWWNRAGVAQVSTAKGGS